MLFSQDLGIDLGTSNTLIYSRGKGITIREPSVVAMDVRETPGKVVAVGSEAKTMIGRTPGSITAQKPLKNGVIADYEMTAEMLARLIKKAQGKSLFNRARVMLCIPSGVTEVERRAVHDAARIAGARYVSLIEVPMAAAIGAGLPVSEPVGSMIADLGAGTSEVAVVSLGDVVASNSVRIGGDDFDEAIIAYIRRKHNLLIGERTAEDIKIKIGSAFPYDGEAAINIKGRNLVDGLPKNVEITSAEVREAISDCVNQIADMIADTLERTPPELASDILDRGITLSGGSALLRGMDKFLSHVTKMPVRIAPEPLDCAVLGTGRCLEKNILNL
ncbi:MAG: rod shape-determining protein [Clostridiales bacterium]|nr:rod shape-determining protein [Clostridiales bacterium]